MSLNLRLRLLLLFGALSTLSALSAATVAHAQQPFVVDDADVTPAGIWHLEISNQVDSLRRSARPARWQNALEWEIAYGVRERMELAVAVPLITIGYAVNDPRGTDSGIGDTTFGVKYRLSSSAETRHLLRRACRSRSRREIAHASSARDWSTTD